MCLQMFSAVAAVPAVASVRWPYAGLACVQDPNGVAWEAGS